MNSEASRPDRDSGAPDADRAARDRRLAGLISSAADGDTTAFEAFYDSSIDYARALARRMLQSGDIEDLLADVYFEAWRNAQRFDAQRGSAVTWLLTIVRSRALDLIRHRVVHPSVGGSESTPSEPGTDPAEDPAERLWRQQEGTRLHAALLVLSNAERWVLGLAYFRDLTHSEIAQCTGLPLGTIKSHMLRAQAKLRTALTH
jgi:RNA polymerase sigma factor (sigma-70 family)